MALPDSLHGLMDAHAYPHGCARIELIETHISWVLLTGDYAYKLKKPAQFSFLDFSTLALREHFCREELRCNRAFAPALYVDVVAVYQGADHTLRMGGDPAPGDSLLEWAVKMRQFDPAAQLDRLLEQDAVTIDMLRQFGTQLATLHASLPGLTAASNEVEARVFGPVDENFSDIQGSGLQADPAALLQQIQSLSDALGLRLLPLVRQRFSAGRFRECHGDLHLSNLALIDGTVTAFDCLEFSPALRWIDPICDVAFLFMDCHYRGRSDLSYAFIDGYLDVSGDYRGVELLSYFVAYRAMVRAKVAALRWSQDHSSASEARFVDHLQWTRQWLERPRGSLILMCGLSASGKSTVAKQLVPMLPAVRLRSDVARKVLAGLDASARTDSPVGGGLYAPGRSDEVFAYLTQVAEALLCDGENVVVDTTFIERARRDIFTEMAKRLAVNVHIVYCRAPTELLQERIQSRARVEQDASEATLAVLDAQLEKFTPPGSSESVIELDTAERISNEQLQLLVQQLVARAQVT